MNPIEDITCRRKTTPFPSRFSSLATRKLLMSPQTSSITCVAKTDAELLTNVFAVDRSAIVCCSVCLTPSASVSSVCSCWMGVAFKSRAPEQLAHA